MNKPNLIATILKGYQNGERHFKGLDIEGDFSGKDLNGIAFEDCFIAADFKYCNLSNASFSNGNIKTSDFRYADLSHSRFENLAVESTQFDWAKTDGIIFSNNYCYGQSVKEKDFEKLFKTNVSRPMFKLATIFKIMNRGIVLAGEIEEGLISVGDCVKLAEEEYLITGVEMIDKVKEKKALVGLIIPVFSAKEITKIKDQNLEGITIEIIKKNNG